MSPRVSVVVPTYKRPDLLRRCLQALLVQELDAALYEVIVADDAGCAETRALVEELSIPLQYQMDSAAVERAEAAGADRLAVSTLPEVRLTLSAHQPQIRYLAVDGAHGPAAARNRGWQASRAEIIAFTDDDTIPAPDWLAEGLAAMEPGVDGASGRVIVPLPENPTDYEKEQLGLERSEFITANCFYRRSALQAAGGFDEAFRMAWREDSDLYFTLLEQGRRLVFAPRAVVLHPIRPAAWGVSLRQQRKTFFNALCYKKHPALYRQKFTVRAPWFYYLMALGGGLALTGLLAGSAVLALDGALIWLLLGGMFARRRLRGTSKKLGHVAEMAVTSLAIPFLSLYWRLRGALRFKVFYF